ncbi:hypothetical protein NPIL_91951 [Nephila pilipes]|uniref:Uncharacterized protein n=1 Tax=Nephila pilipes TaxID=299642 RepID=A0A8X6QD32_NEPPI|nr:hypothetical protein NPIL_91951 [Nephila pilipes]
MSTEDGERNGLPKEEDLQATTAEIIYGTHIRLLGEFLCPSKQNADPATFVGRQRVNAASISSNDSTSRTKYDFREQGFDHMQPYFSADRLYNKCLYPPYEGSYKIVNRIEKVFRILRHGKEVSVSVDQLKLACVPKELVDIPAGVLGKKKVSSEPYEFLDTGEETSTGSSGIFYRT